MLPQVVPAAEWRASFEALLTKEKALTAARDELAAERRRMPMTQADPDYSFLGPQGELTLLDLFEGRRQLIVYRFFYAPDVEGWPDGACSGCSHRQAAHRVSCTSGGGCTTNTTNT